MRWMAAGMRWTAIVLVGLWLTGCQRESPEDRVRAGVAQLEQAVRAREPGALRDVLAEDFVGNGGLDREGAVRMAQVSYLRYRDVGVSLGPVTVQMHGDRATVRFTAVLTGGEGMLPETGRAYEVVSGWRADGDDWMLVSAEWTPVL